MPFALALHFCALWRHQINEKKGDRVCLVTTPTRTLMTRETTKYTQPGVLILQQKKTESHLVIMHHAEELQLPPEKSTAVLLMDANGVALHVIEVNQKNSEQIK
jgi:hypothetical protein